MKTKSGQVAWLTDAGKMARPNAIRVEAQPADPGTRFSPSVDHLYRQWLRELLGAGFADRWLVLLRREQFVRAGNIVAGYSQQRHRDQHRPQPELKAASWLPRLSGVLNVGHTGIVAVGQLPQPESGSAAREHAA